MAKKSADFTVHFYYPTTEDGTKILAEALGDVHTKLIQELVDKNIMDGTIKNKMISKVQKELMLKSMRTEDIKYEP